MIKLTEGREITRTSGSIVMKSGEVRIVRKNGTLASALCISADDFNGIGPVLSGLPHILLCHLLELLFNPLRQVNEDCLRPSQV